MTLDFDDLPPLTERCDCWEDDRGVRVRHQPVPGTSRSDYLPCADCCKGRYGRERPTEFGRAVLDLVARFGGRGEAGGS